MSKATKRKHVTKEILEDYYVPENGEEIVKIIAARGNNLHQVETSTGSVFLASMPTKFRKNVWVKRGDFVIITPIKEGNKVQGEIVYILYNKQIQYLKKEQLWPSGFDDELPKPFDKKETSLNETKESNGKEDEYSDSDEESDDDLLENPNHRQIYTYDDDTESSSEGESTDDKNNEEEGDDLEIGKIETKIEDFKI